MKIIGFIASPHKEGNTAWIVNKILEGAKEQGAETQSYYFSDLDIKPCRGCLSCHNKGDRGCIMNDDMQKIYFTIEQADAIVFGSPIYMGQMSAQAKIFVDRLHPLFAPRFSPSFQKQNAGKEATQKDDHKPIKRIEKQVAGEPARRSRIANCGLRIQTQGGQYRDGQARERHDKYRPGA